jgi:hypothetical protein
MSETMGHEVGHYLGLYHPVEDGWRYWDALDDTLECGSTAECESALKDNLLFPYPVCTRDACEPQVNLTEAQRVVIGNYVLLGIP